MSKPYRLAQRRPPHRPHEEASPSPSTARRCTGFAGDTLASAVMASGQRVFGRSFKYHRPRGVIGLGSEEMNALVGVGEGARHEPNLRATQVEIFNGLSAVSQNRWPSLNWDIGAINNTVLALHPRRLLLQDLHVARRPSGSMSTSPSSAARRAWARRRKAAIPTPTSRSTSIATCW